MIVYHTISTDKLQTVLKEGLKCASRGEKGDDASIAKADKYLDGHRPEKFISAHVSRDDNLYAYVADDDHVIDITDGEKVDINTFADKQDYVVLQIEVATDKCYVSDIDSFDAVKTALDNNENQRSLDELATKYWQNVRSLKDFSIGDIRRPEVMITYDVNPDNIKPLK